MSQQHHRLRLTCDPADPHFDEFQCLEEEVRRLRTVAGDPYRLVPLPWAPVRLHPHDGHWLPATYANFLIVNEAVLVPTYNEPQTDAAAIAAVQRAFPGYTVEGIDCSTLINEHGSLHCATMQVPAVVWQQR